MTPEEQCIAIAEACGWTYLKTELGTYWWNDELNKTLPPDDDGFRPCPDYLNDLNAMHEAETVMTDQQRTSYLDKLYEVCNPHSMLNDDWNLTCATACQRAEAFIRTIGKWKEAKP